MKKDARMASLKNVVVTGYCFVLGAGRARGKKSGVNTSLLTNQGAVGNELSFIDEAVNNPDN